MGDDLLVVEGAVGAECSDGLPGGGAADGCPTLGLQRHQFLILGSWQESVTKAM